MNKQQHLLMNFWWSKLNRQNIFPSLSCQSNNRTITRLLSLIIHRISLHHCPYNFIHFPRSWNMSGFLKNFPSSWFLSYSECPWNTLTEWMEGVRKSHKRNVVSVDEVTISCWVGWVQVCVSSWSWPKDKMWNYPVNISFLGLHSKY